MTCKEYQEFVNNAVVSAVANYSVSNVSLDISKLEFQPIELAPEDRVIWLSNDLNHRPRLGIKSTDHQYYECVADPLADFMGTKPGAMICAEYWAEPEYIEDAS